VHGDLASVLAALGCGAFITVTEPATASLLRRLAASDQPGLRSSSEGILAEALLASMAATIQAAEGTSYVD
jgi:hypothetical protein